MHYPVPARGIPAHEATGPGGSAPGVCTPEAAAQNAVKSLRATSSATTSLRSSGSSAPLLEPLEDRRLLSSVSLNNGVLQLVGDANSPNHLVVQPSGSSNLFVYANNANKTVARSAVKSIRFIGGARDDSIFLASTLKYDTSVMAGAGNDDVRIGAGNDTVDGGDGNDRLWTRAGNDKITGGKGNDSIQGFEGDDTIEAGDGDDSVDAGQGNDAVVGGAGDDSIIGNLGNDKLDGGDGDDWFRADAGNDTMLGGAGDDTLGGGSGSDYFDGGSGKNTYTDIRAEDRIPAGSSYGTPGGGNGNSSGGVVPVGITDNEDTIVGKTIDSQTPRPVINLIGKTGTGPHTVHVHALATTLNGGTYLTARWQWDFGDPAGKYNYLEGWNAAHIYDNPGTYTIKLTVTNENGKSNSLTTTVKVVADVRRTIYVDAVAGKDSNSGLSASAPVRTVDRVQDLAASHTRILFKRGQKFVFDRSLSLPFQDVYVGAYGSGERPLLWRVRNDGFGVSTIATYDNSNQITVEDLIFDSPYPAKSNGPAPNIGVDGFYPRGVNMTIRGCEFLNLDDAVNANGDPRGLMVQDNTAPLATGLRNYFIWSEGSDHVYLGNSAANSTREHNVRSSGTVRYLAAYNNFTNLDRSDVDPPDYSKGTIEVHRGGFAYIWRNELHDGPLRSGPRGAEFEPVNVTTDWVVFDSNEVYDHAVMIKIGTRHLIARNNIVRTKEDSAFIVETTDEWGRTVDDITIVNNTGITQNTYGKFLNLPMAGGTKGAITLKNNLWINPTYEAGSRGSAPVAVYASNLDMFKEISNNVWQKPKKVGSYGEGGMHYVWDFWSDRRGYKDAKEWDAYSNVHDEFYADTPVTSDLTPKSGSVATTAGSAVKGVLTDFYGHARPLTGRVTVGAVQA